MAELFLSAVLPVLFEKLTSPELLDFATREGVGSKLNKLKKKLGLINALLIDAEMKLTDGHGAVKIWLDELQDLAYDAEDILDEYATEALTRKLTIDEHQASTSTARKLIPACCFGYTPSALRSNFRIGSEIDDITSRLEDLYNERTGLGLEVNKSGGSSSVSLQRTTPTTCFPTEPVVHGRDEDKAKILEMLTNETSDAIFGVVPIVGMGGLGKTTLARQVYNDKAVGDFNLKAWVCVSDDFDVTSISKAIYESITGRSCAVKDLNAVQSQLVKEVSGKRLLLVLDDVWTEDDDLWEKLKAPFMCAAPGSKMIVTTRLQEVVKTVRRRKGGYELKLLSDDDCWSLFKQCAFDDSDDVAHWDLQAIRQKVVQKCNGLPLAAKALGGLLCRKGSEDEWMEILDNKIWDISGEDKILPVLKLSYHHLPSNLKRCFAYCAIFPKDYEFEEKELVFLWMAEGLIQKSRENKQLEKLGSEYFRDLVSRSIFQISSSNNSKFIMHDLVNDLAQMVSGEQSFRLEGEPKSNNQSNIFEKIRYSSHNCHYFNHKSNFEVFNNAKLLRTHLSLGLESYDFCCRYISNSVVSELLLKFKKLRALSLQRYEIVELSNSMGDLRLLRYLNLSYCGIISLPDSINSMCNLQTLLLRKCRSLEKLPDDMGKLINLRHLDISGASLIEKMPLGVRKWKSLQTLSNFIVGKNLGSSLKELKHLEFLYGQLCISRLENVIDSEKTIILSDKHDLKVLLLEWGSEFDDSRDEEVHKKVLDMLRPHKNLEELTIKCYGGTEFPSWLGDHNSFSKMAVLTLEGCKNCTSLPSLGLLSSLKDLTIRGMTGLKSIGSEFYGEGFSDTFQSLETLCFENLEEWERWDPVKGNDGVESFPKLRELSVVGCPKLSETLPSNLSLLKKLVIHNCPALVVSVSTFPVLCKLEIDECKKIVCSSPTGSNSLTTVTLSNVSDFGNWQDFQRVDVLVIKGCDDLINLWQNEIFLEKPPHGLHSLISIRELYMENCKTLTNSLLEGIRQRNEHLETLEIRGCHSPTFIFRGQLPPSLKKLYIEECEKLQCLLDDNESRTYSSSSMMHKEINFNSHTSHLDELEITECPSLTCLPLRDQFSATLTSLVLRACSKLTTVWLPVGLKRLEIYECPELTTLLLRDQLPETLETLRIESCGKLESIVERFHNNAALYMIWISCCSNLKSIPDGLYTLRSLRDIHIWGCQDLVSFPKGGFPDSILEVSICDCEKLTALPSRIHTLTSLQSLHILDCPSLSYPEEGFPANLSVLRSPNLYKPLTNLEFHNLTSLEELSIYEYADAESFHKEEMEMTLPHSLTWLLIEDFPKLKCLSCNSLENLTSLKYLTIQNCPNLTSLPNLPSSLLSLYIHCCPLLKKAYERNKGKEWCKISDIPHVENDGRIRGRPYLIFGTSKQRKIFNLSPGPESSSPAFNRCQDFLCEGKICGLLSGVRDFILLPFFVLSWSSWCSFFFWTSPCGSMF